MSEGVSVVTSREVIICYLSFTNFSFNLHLHLRHGLLHDWRSNSIFFSDLFSPIFSEICIFGRVRCDSIGERLYFSTLESEIHGYGNSMGRHRSRPFPVHRRRLNRCSRIGICRNYWIRSFYTQHIFSFSISFFAAFRWVCSQAELSDRVRIQRFANSSFQPESIFQYINK